jgi:hypothetical protein
MKRASLTRVLSILPFLGIEGCAATVDVQVLDLDTGTVVGQLRPSFFGKYRDMLVGVDEVSGRLAVVEWGDRRSTLKIITLQPWRVSEQTIDAGRVTYGTGTPRLIEGIAGPMAYDFATRRFFYTTGPHSSGACSLYSIGADGEKQNYALPTCGGGLLPYGESIFLHSLTSPEGAYSILKFSLADNSCSEVHRSDASLMYKKADLGEKIGVVEERNGKDDRAIHLILFEKRTSRKTERRLPVAGYRCSLEDGILAAISRDDSIVYWTPIESKEAPKEIKVEARGNVWAVYASKKYLFLLRSEKGNRLEPLVIEVATGCTKELKEMLPGANVMSTINRIQPLSCGGKNLVILSD